MGKRILVADDSLTIQKAFAMVLGGQDYTLLTARSVDEALVAAKGGRPDLVIADAVLGAGNGYDLCASLKADPSLRGVPVHILASSQNPLDEARARRVGADGHLLKPFDSQTMLDSVSAALLTPARPAPAPVAEVPAARVAPIPPWPSFEHGVVTDEVLAPEDESYGEFTIERGSAAGPAAWTGRPPTWPGARPAPAATPPPSTASRPSLIPGVSPPTPAPASRLAPPLPGVTAAPAAASAPRPTANRTIMGFPGVGGPAQAPSAPPVSSVAARPPVPRPSAPAPIPRAAPPIPVAPSPPAAVAAQAPARRSGTMPVVAPAATPVPPTTVAAQAPARRSGSMPVVGPAGAPAPLVAAVSSAIDQKVAAIAARGREYEAIAKLSREIIEQVVWEVVPELAEVIIRQELDRLTASKK
jgi:CheY-like chemotaxis protein